MILITCSEKLKKSQPNINFENLETDYMEWWVYHSKNIVLSPDFIPLNENSNQISKNDFLKKLTSGTFIPLKLESKDGLLYYQLFRLDNFADISIGQTIKRVSTKDYKYFKMEGKKFPDFDLIDLNGKTYSNDNTKGKIVILKCWFITCKPCIAEFSKLNKLVEKYQNRNDILFISLAFESKDDLQEFLIKKPFAYAIVPDQKEFMEKILKIHSNPTHFIIDKNGVIQKVVNKVDEMISIMESEKFINKNPIKRLTPPPPAARKHAN